MLTLKTAIKQIEEYEQENNKLKEQIEFFQRKTQRLEKRNKEIYEGFIITIQELCDTTKELDDYKSRCEKAIKWIDKHTEIYTKNGISIIDWDNFSDPKNLKNILGGDEE